MTPRARRHAAPLPSLPGIVPEAAAPACAGWECCGIDEVGRGCLAGPVVACAVSLPEGLVIPGLDDSKKLSPAAREAAAALVRGRCLAFGLGVVWPWRIDEINILQATFEAMSRAVLGLARRRAALLGGDPVPPGLLVVDGSMRIPAATLARVLAPALGEAAALPPEPALARAGVRQRSVVRGDSLVPAISAASVVAKVWRDRLMGRLARRWPGYGFEIHKGYGTRAHCEALRRLGPCPMHRLSFRGVAQDGEETPSPAKGERHE